jgi:hypothetical protein
MTSCEPRAAAVAVDSALVPVGCRADFVWSRRTVHFGAVSPLR